jgi:hypothetical protein
MDFSLSTTGDVTIVPDVRLNALVVEANPADRELIEQLLEVIDQEASPENVETVHPPKLIPVYYTSAQEVAETVREVFAPNLAAGRNGQRQPSPEEFIRALRGGRGGRDSSSRRSQEQQLMTVGVDERSNSLVVSAPDALMRQVEQLVEQLDQAGVESEQVMQVISVRRADPAVVQQAISALVNQSRTSSTSRTSTRSSTSQTSTSSRPSGSSAMDQMRQRMMMLNQMRSAASSGASRAPAPSSRGSTPSSRGPTSRFGGRGR